MAEKFASIEDMNEYDRVKGIVSKWTPEQYSKALQNDHDPKVKEAITIFDRIAMDRALVSAKRESSFTPPVKGILGFKTLLPNWMGGNTVNWEEPPPYQGESPGDYKLRAELTYAEAFDHAKSQGIPIVRMREHRGFFGDRRDAPDEMTNPANYIGGKHIDPDTRKWAGRLYNLEGMIPGLHAMAANSSVDSAETPRERAEAEATNELMRRAGEEEAPVAERALIPLLGGLALPGIGELGGAGAITRVANNPIVRGGLSGAAGGAIESASQGGSLEDIKGAAKTGGLFGGAFGTIGAIGGKAARLVNEGSMKEDIANLRMAGGRPSLLKGFKFPGLVENATDLKTRTPGVAGPAADVAYNIRDPFMTEFIRERSVPAAKFEANLKGYESNNGSVRIVPHEYGIAFANTFRDHVSTPGSEQLISKLRQQAPKVYEPISLKNGTLVMAHDNALGKSGLPHVTVQEAEAMGLHVDIPEMPRQPPVTAADTLRGQELPPPTTPTVGMGPNLNATPPIGRTWADEQKFWKRPETVPPESLEVPSSLPNSGRTTQVDTGPIRLDPNAFRVILKPREMTPSGLRDAEDFLFDGVEKGSPTAEKLKPVLTGLMKSRDRFPADPDYAPASLKAKLDDGTEVTGYSALNRLRSQEIERLSHGAERLGVRPTAMENPVHLEEDITNAILGFHRAENPNRGIAALEMAKKLPGGEQALYSAPLAEKAASMQGKASIARNVPMGFLSFKPFFRAVGIHAEPVTSRMPAKTPGVAAAAGAEGSDLSSLVEMADELAKEKASRVLQMIPPDARLLMR